MESLASPPAALAATPAAEALDSAYLGELARELDRLHEELASVEREGAGAIAAVHPDHRASGRNLLHYLALRRRDRRELQARLAWVGLSSLGRSEAHVRITLDRVRAMLALARGERLPDGDGEPPPVGFRQGEQLLVRNAAALLGPPRRHRAVRILVTLPSEAAGDYSMVRDLVARGMDCARINCAHDDAAAWRAMIGHVERAREELGIGCRVLMDLAGPKLRTGAPVGGAEHVRLAAGDRLTLRLGDEVPGGDGGDDDRGDGAAIACPVPEVFRDARPGEPIWFDDGKLGGVIESRSADRLTVRVIHARPRGTKLRAEKGVNLPETTLDLPALAGKDLEDLEVAARHADLVGLSFCQREEDVFALQEALGRLDVAGRQAAGGAGIVLKIETRTGFRNLPRLLLAALRSRSAGVMIARGDLAVEAGYQRLAEVQEEMLWLCEAAHVPTIWATQVLETLAKKGLPSRAEITDAAMSGRAEAVMLNKGPYILDAIECLDDILGRMQAHQTKKRALLRPLRVAAV